MGERLPEGGGLDNRIGCGIDERVAEDALMAGWEVALDLAPGGGVGNPVEFVEETGDGVGAVGVEFDRLVRARPDEQEAQLLGWNDLRDRMGRRAATLRRRHLPAADVQELVG